MWLHHPRRGQQISKPGEDRVGGVVSLEIGNVGPYPGRGYSIGRRVGPVELPAAVKRSQPVPIITDEAAIRVLAVPGAGTTLLKQVSRNESGLPPSPIRLRPLFEGLAAAIGVLMKNFCHRTFNFRDRAIEVTNGCGCFETGVI